REEELVPEAKRPVIDAGDVGRRRRDRDAEVKLDQVLREARGMRRAAAGAGYHQLRRAANEAGREVRQRRGQLALLSAERLGRLVQLLRHAHQMFTSSALSTGRTPETANASRALMCCMRTEHPSPRYSAIDLWDPAEILDAMLEGQFAAVAAVHAARLALERAAVGIEERLRGGGRLVYAGAGTSGRLAVQD